jgi:hypothetical protein
VPPGIIRERRPGFRMSPWLCCFLLLCQFALASSVSAQQVDDPRALRALQDSIESMRKQRLQLEAATERVLADSISARAKRLAMGGEVGALQRLELLLDSAQARLLVQRDRIRVLKDASVQTDQAVLVVLVRADALPAGEVAAVIMVDGTQRASVVLKPDQVKTIVSGASDELFRGEISPADHKVLLQIAAKGLSVGEMIAVPASPRAVTYVEFSLKGGRLVSTTWTNRATGF